jgi:hypothetical protein
LLTWATFPVDFEWEEQLPVLILCVSPGHCGPLALKQPGHFRGALELTVPSKAIRLFNETTVSTALGDTRKRLEGLTQSDAVYKLLLVEGRSEHPLSASILKLVNWNRIFFADCDRNSTFYKFFEERVRFFSISDKKDLKSTPDPWWILAPLPLFKAIYQDRFPTPAKTLLVCAIYQEESSLLDQALNFVAANSTNTASALFRFSLGSSVSPRQFDELTVPCLQVSLGQLRWLLDPIMTATNLNAMMFPSSSGRIEMNMSDFPEWIVPYDITGQRKTGNQSDQLRERLYAGLLSWPEHVEVLRHRNLERPIIADYDQLKQLAENLKRTVATCERATVFTVSHEPSSGGTVAGWYLLDSIHEEFPCLALESCDFRDLQSDSAPYCQVRTSGLRFLG